jgi:molybdate transport system substrate-binding protein
MLQSSSRFNCNHKKMKRFLTGIACLAFVCFPAVACEILVAAASDLAPLEPELKKVLPECRFRFSFGSSGALARQIEAGADFDVYLAASRSFVDQLVRGGNADSAQVVPYARGRIALWSRSGLKWQDLRRADRIAIANPALAPYGLAAKQALQKQGLWEAVRRKIVFGENIRQAWQFAETGNVDAGIVSWSLVYQKGGQLLPESWHAPIEQTGVIPKRSAHPADARRFLDALVSAAGQKMLSSHGLEPVRLTSP